MALHDGLLRELDGQRVNELAHPWASCSVVSAEHHIELIGLRDCFVATWTAPARPALRNGLLMLRWDVVMTNHRLANAPTQSWIHEICQQCCHVVGDACPNRDLQVFGQVFLQVSFE